MIPQDIRERYLEKKNAGCFSRVKPSESERTLDALSKDLLFLVELFLTRDEVAALKSYRQLQRVLEEHCEVSGGEGEKKVTVKPAKEVPSNSLQNPSDPDATYDGHKGQGYQIQIMETFTPEGEKDETKPELITYVEVQPAHMSDAKELLPALKSAQARDCGPETVLGDSLYGSDNNVLAAAELGVEVIAPAMGTEEKGTKLHFSNFTYDEQKKVITACPAGQAPVEIRNEKDGIKRVSFDVGSCQNCPLRDQCPTRVGKRTARFYYNPKQIRLSLRRTIEETKEWQDQYRMRAGVEGSISRLKLQTGAGRLRVRGLEKVRFAGILKATGINILRSAKALAAQAKAVAARMRDEIAQNKGVSEADEALCFFFGRIFSFLTVLFIKPGTLTPACENS
ncbi:MAG: transposase [Candidatus Xenobiia bacterium LiM19]